MHESLALALPFCVLAAAVSALRLQHTHEPQLPSYCVRCSDSVQEPVLILALEGKYENNISYPVAFVGYWHDPFKAVSLTVELTCLMFPTLRGSSTVLPISSATPRLKMLQETLVKCNVYVYR